MGDLSENFSRSEFACTCGCGFDTVDAETLEVLEDLRAWAEVPVHITSGARCKKYNASVGGAENSQHLIARAGDVHVEGINPPAVFKYLVGKYPNKYGVGLYALWVHIDTRKGKARWTK